MKIARWLMEPALVSDVRSGGCGLFLCDNAFGFYRAGNEAGNVEERRCLVLFYCQESSRDLPQKKRILWKNCWKGAEDAYLVASPHRCASRRSGCALTCCGVPREIQFDLRCVFEREGRVGGMPMELPRDVLQRRLDVSAGRRRGGSDGQQDSANTAAVSAFYAC